MTDNSNSNSNTLAAELRRSIRDQILSTKAETRILSLFGTEVELRQPDLREIMNYNSQEDRSAAAADMVIRYLYVPGTNVRIFEDSDVDAVLNLPFGPDMQRLQKAVNELTGTEAVIQEAQKNSHDAQAA